MPDDMDMIITSSLRRIVETGKIAAEKKHIAMYVAAPPLIEQNYGVFVGVDRKSPNF